MIGTDSKNKSNYEKFCVMNLIWNENLSLSVIQRDPGDSSIKAEESRTVCSQREGLAAIIDPWLSRWPQIQELVLGVFSELEAESASFNGWSRNMLAMIKYLRHNLSSHHERFEAAWWRTCHAAAYASIPRHIGFHFCAKNARGRLRAAQLPAIGTRLQ
jgi:hypothetical protein